MIGVLFALGAALSSGIEKILRRSVLIKEDSLCYAFTFGLFAGIVLLPLFFFRFQMPSNNLAWLLMLLSGGLWTLYSVMLSKAYSYLEVSIASPLSRLKLFFVMLLSAVFLHEALTIGKVAGTTLIFFGIAALSYKGGVRVSLKDKGVILIVLSTFVISVALLIDKFAMGFFNVETYTAPVYLMTPLLLIPFVLKRKTHIKSIVKNSLIATFSAAVLSVGYYYLTLYAFKYAEASVVVPITEISTLIGVLGGIILLKERTHIARKLIASALVIIGSILVSF